MRRSEFLKLSVFAPLLALLPWGEHEREPEPEPELEPGPLFEDSDTAEWSTMTWDTTDSSIDTVTYWYSVDGTLIREIVTS